MHEEKVWKKIKSELHKELDDNTVSTWFETVTVKEVSNETITINAPNKFVSDWIKSNYRKELAAAAGMALGKRLKINIEHQNIKPESQAEIITKREIREAGEQKSDALQHYQLNPKYIFDTFVVGPSNQFAHAACKAVAEKKAKNYNPLFIYGGVGLGKTHLLNAVGNELYTKNPNLNVICIQAESFMNEMIQAIRKEKMDHFRKRYRKECDILLMDDIEILAGKERTQEEFFYTFNDLYLAGKKIIMTSDKFPKEMTTLEERLRSRFESGIIVDIQPPEFETRLAILRHKAEDDGINIPEEVTTFMAERIRSNIRKLEGSLLRLSAVASLSGSPITIELADEVIRAIMDDASLALSSDSVIKAVANYFKVKVSDIKSPKRNRKFTVPRQIAMYLTRELCDMSFPEIGQAFGGRDHSTVIHSCKKVGIDKNTDFELKRHLDILTKQLKSGDA